MQGTRLFAAVLVTLVVCGTGIAFGAQDYPASDASPSQEALALSAAPQTEPGAEVEAKRTANSQTYRLADGTFETRLYETPINYWDSSGQWKPIDEDLRPQADGSGLSNGANRFDVSLPERLGSDPVRFALASHWISIRLEGSPSEPVEREDANTASYLAADAGTSFAFTSLPGGLKENIEIASPAEPHSFAFELEVSEGLVPELEKDGSIQLRDPDGQPVAELPAPVMFDSSPRQPQVSHDIHYELSSQTARSWRLTLSADSEWLKRPDLSWPVTLDPTLTFATPSMDCTISGTAGANGAGLCASKGQKELLARYRRISGKDEWSRSLIQFDLDGDFLNPSLPALPSPFSNPLITSATLSVHSPAPVLNTSGLEARQVTKAWSSALDWRRYQFFFNWANEGGDYSSEGSQILTADRGAQAGWWNFDLTALAQKWASPGLPPASAPNNGVILKLLDDKSGCCAERSAVFDSSAASDPGVRPYLSVTYYLPAPSSSKVSAPTEGTQTARFLKLAAKWSESATSGVSFQWREGSSGAFKTIPPGLVRDAKGQSVSWPMAVSGPGESKALFFDVLNASSSLKATGGEVQVRALFEGPTGVAGYSLPAKATVDPFIGATNDATAPVGPGSVDLLTGNFTTTRTDVSIPVFSTSLEFARTHSSRDASKGGNAGLLGPGWVPAATVEEAGGSEWRGIRILAPSPEEEEEGFGAYALLTDLEAYEYAFEAEGSGFISPPGAEGYVLSRVDETHLALTDPDGNRTLFESGAGGEYLPVSVTQTGGSFNSTRLIYEFIGDNRRLKMVIAPSPGLECAEIKATTTPGCRALTFSYKPASTWGAPSGYGDRLAAITYHGPSGPNSNSGWEVAKYSYDSAGRLTQEWDPRISPALKETYAYASGGPLQTITPPGEEPWTLEYKPLEKPGEAAGRLEAVKRASLLGSPSVAQTTIAYGVPVSGAGAPYDLSPTAVAGWGQQDVPAEATAIFPPDQIPASPPSSYSRATVYYMDAEGQTVNVATPSGAGTSAPSITTAETDEHGNVVRALSAQNRLRALAAGSESAARSHELETKRVFSADGTEMQEELGPLHEIRLESGETTQARMRKTVEYDQGMTVPLPGQPMPHLPTRETVGALTSKPGPDLDVRVTETKYDWGLRKPTETIVDPEGLNIRSRTVYQFLTGLPIEIRQPADPDGGDAHTTVIHYYGMGGGGLECELNKPAYRGLPCKVEPGSEPLKPKPPLNSELLVKTYLAYSSLGQPTEVIESLGGGAANARKTLTTFDAAGRQTSARQEDTAAYSSPVLADSPAGHWRLGEASGTVATDASGGDNGTYTNSPTLGATSLLAGDSADKAVSFDGVNDHVRVTSSAALSPSTSVSAEAWIKPTSLPSSGNFASVLTKGESYSIQFNGPRLEFTIMQNGARKRLQAPEGAVVAGQSYHVVGTYDGATQRLYLNGAQVASTALSGTITTNSTALEIGSWEGGEEFFKGTIDEAAVYPTTLSAARVKAHYDAGKGATILAPIQTTYDAETGRPIEQRFTCQSNCGSFDDQATTTVYDTLGRVTEYEDADGNLSLTGYDLLGRPVVSSDGMGTQTRIYDPTSGLLVELYDSGAGYFTASYDADGNLVEEGLPNGLLATTTYDEIGAPVHLSYEKASGCSIECTWLDFGVEESIHGQWLTETSDLSTQHYSYDKAGRLAVVRDTPQGGGCTTRSYSFDADSNRTALISRAPGIGGACDLSSKGNEQTYSYDAADRLIGSGVAYDSFGRITSLPSAYSGGGKLETSYYVNDLTQSQSQDGITNTYLLDSSLRQRQRTQSGGSEPGTEIYHYAGGSDSPAWIDEGEGEWTRFIGGLGAMAIEDGATEEITLQLPNLHGDIIATADIDPKATELLSSFEFDEFGNPKQEATPKFGWLGGKGRRTELPSGVVQMGVRSYVPALGRFLTPDPVFGGSANAYEYAGGDPVNNLDLTGGECESPNSRWAKRCKRINKQIQAARSAVRKAARILRALVREERAERRVKLWNPLPKVDFPVISNVTDFLEAIPGAIKQVDEKTSCTSSGAVGSSAGVILYDKAEGIFGVGTKLAGAAQRVGKRFGLWGAALTGAGAVGIC